MQFMSIPELDIEGTYIDYCLFQMTGKTCPNLMVILVLIGSILFLSTNPAYRNWEIF